MCRIPKVVVIAPREEHLDLRRRLSSLEYDIVATLAPDADVDLSADVAIVRDASPDAVTRLRGKGLKVVSFGAPATEADLDLGEDVESFKARIWDLLRAQA